MSDRVQFEDDELVLVDDRDSELGRASKRDCHLGAGRTHRAFATVLVDGQGRLLLARRAPQKPLWPGYWDATFASHPGPGESYVAASDRRAPQELGVAVRSTLHGRFRYRIAYGSIGFEDELCAALVAEVAPDLEFAPEPAEIDALRWVSVEELTAELERGEAPIAPWMPLTLLAIPRSGPAASALALVCRTWLDAQPFEGRWRLLEGG